MYGKAQSAIEFLNTYSFVFIVLGVVMAMLFVLVRVPSAVMPSQCSFYGGFTCSESGYAVNAISGNTIVYVLAVDGQPGVVNISSFSANVTHVGAASGSCSPSRVVQGELAYCTAELPTAATLGSIYQGSFVIKGNYCTPKLSNSLDLNCPGSSQFVFPGSINAQAVKGLPKFTSTTSTIAP